MSLDKKNINKFDKTYFTNEIERILRGLEEEDEFEEFDQQLEDLLGQIKKSVKCQLDEGEGEGEDEDEDEEEGIEEDESEDEDEGEDEVEDENEGENENEKHHGKHHKCKKECEKELKKFLKRILFILKNKKFGLKEIK